MKPSIFLSNVKYFYARTDGTYAFPNSAEGDLIKQAVREIEELRSMVSQPPSDNAANIVAEYLESKRIIDIGPPREYNNFGPPKTWRHGDPEVIRFHAATAALHALAAQANVNKE